ncbi:hypothetical protein D3C80_1580790 [compost metagenome]
MSGRMPRSEFNCTPCMRTLSKISPRLKSSPAAKVPLRARTSRSTKVRLLRQRLSMLVPPVSVESLRRRQPIRLKPLRRPR